MANRNDYYFRQRVTESELDLGFTNLELADRNMAVDWGLIGIFFGAVASQASPGPNMTVDLTGPAAGYDPQGQRIGWGPKQNVNVALDSNSVATAVATPANTKWVSIFMQFTRSLTDERVDGNNANVFFNRYETVQFIVAQAAETAASPNLARVPLRSDALLVCDIKLSFGDTTVLNAVIDITRRQNATLTLSGTPLATYNTHIDGSGDRHNADKVNYTRVAGTPTWANGDTVPANSTTGVDGTLKTVVNGLAASATPAGSDWTGARAIAIGINPYGMTGGTLQTALASLLTNLINHATSPSSHAHLASQVDYGGGGALGAADLEVTLDDVGARALFTNVNRTVSATMNFADITASGGGKYKLSSRTITRVLGNFTVDGATWAQDNQGNGGCPTQQISDANGGSVVCPLDFLPDGATIIELKANLLPAAGHTGSPTTLPKIKLRSIAQDGTLSTLATGTDPWTSTPVYEVEHQITTGAISFTINKATTRYIAQFSGEAGAGSLFIQLLQLYTITVIYTVTSMDDG